MKFFFKIGLSLVALAVIVMLFGIYKFNFSNEDIYIVQSNGEVVSYVETQKDTAVLDISVGMEMVDCEGVAPMKCLIVDGEYFYDEIIGFDFEPGYEYEIKVKQTQVFTPENAPADASLYKYELIEIVEKKEVQIIDLGGLENYETCLANLENKILSDTECQVDGRVYSPKNIIDHGGLYTYETCVEAQGVLVGSESNAQCVIQKKAFFKTGQPQIDLNYCDSYYDGCNTCSVTNGVLGGCTFMYCEIEQDAPTCFSGDLVVEKNYGRVIEITEKSIDMVFDDIAMRLENSNNVNLAGVNIGDERAVFYSYPVGTLDYVLVNIR